MTKYTLGIDTSCYTTSLAIVDNKNQLVIDERKVLEVKKGNRGLRQSEAVFQHVRNFPLLFERISKKVDTSKISSVCSSSSPRNIEKSYMPAFLPGISFGKTIAVSLNANYREFSHQEGHIEAAKWSADTLSKDRFIALHISGGTTEILEVIKLENRYCCRIFGGTKDISAGQLIDRIGVMLGLGFPAGRELEQISKEGKIGKLKLPVSTKETYINYSGVETYTKKIVDGKKENNSDIAIALFESIYKSLFRVLKKASDMLKINEILLVGGVASNEFLRDNLYRELKKNQINTHFGKPRFCTDNAVGIALLGNLFK